MIQQDRFPLTSDLQKTLLTFLMFIRNLITLLLKFRKKEFAISNKSGNQVLLKRVQLQTIFKAVAGFIPVNVA